MKRIITYIVLFLLSVGLLYILYIDLLKISLSTILILFVVLLFYGFCMAFGEKGIREIKKQEQKLIHFGLTSKDLSQTLRFALLALSPTYFLCFLVSLLPIRAHGLWLFTVFPCIYLSCVPATSVFEDYHALTHKKLPFVLGFFSVVTAACLGGTLISLFVLEKYII